MVIINQLQVYLSGSGRLCAQWFFPAHTRSFDLACQGHVHILARMRKLSPPSRFFLRKSFTQSRFLSTWKIILPCVWVRQEPLVCLSLLGPISSVPSRLNFTAGGWTCSAQVYSTNVNITQQYLLWVWSSCLDGHNEWQAVVQSPPSGAASDHSSPLPWSQKNYSLSTMGRQDLPHCYSLANSMVANGQVLLFNVNLGCWVLWMPDMLFP